MKLKDIFSPVLLIILGLAFLVVTLWVFLSKNKNAKAIKYKYKLGGLILSFLSFTTACTQSTCYDPKEPDNFTLSYNETIHYERGDTVFFRVSESTYNYYSYQIMDSISQKKLQEGLLKYIKDKDQFMIPIDTLFNYAGGCQIMVYGELSEEIKQQRYIYSCRIEIYATKED